jgi:hypothetical protein
MCTARRPSAAFSLGSRIEETTSSDDPEKLHERLTKLVGGVAIIKVRVATETELKDKKARVEETRCTRPRRPSRKRGAVGRQLSRCWRICGLTRSLGRVYSVEKDDPQPHVDLAFGFLMVNPPPVMVSTKSTSAPFRYWMLVGSTNSLMPCDSNT